MNFLPLTFILFCIFPFISNRGLHQGFSWSRITYDWPNGQPPATVSRFGLGSDEGSDFMFPGSISLPHHPTRRPSRPYSSTAKPSQPESSNAYSDAASSYVYQNNIPMGANVWGNKLFITVPRRRVGIPSTLNYIWVNSTQNHNVPLIPYPDWDTNTVGNADGIRFISVYRVAVDPCDRLWVMDTGTIETPGTWHHVQNNSLIVMDLKTNKILHRYVFDDSVIRPATNLASVTVDVDSNKCDDAYAYFPDLAGYGLVVYSLKKDKAWRVSHNYFFLEPHAGEFSIGGHDFQWNDGIFSISTSDVKSDGHRHAYFHAMAGHNQYRVNTKILKDEDLATRNYHMSDFEIVGRKGNQSQTSASDLYKPRGVLFLGLVNQNAVACWNIESPLSDIDIVQKDDKKMIYPCDVKISGDSVVVLTNTMPVFLYGQLDYNQTNFRVWIEPVDIAIKDTKCDKPSKSKRRY